MSQATGRGPRVVRGGLRAAVACALVLPAFAPSASAEALGVTHDPPACFLADTFPRLDVALASVAPVARLRVAFRPEASASWHAVTAEPVDGGFRAILPRPRLAARRVHYRFESVGADAGAAASADYAADVVADAAACRGRVAESAPSARVLVEVPPGAPMVPPVPPGFDPVGAVSATPHKATGRKKLGLLAGVIVGGGAVAGGVIAAQSEPPPTTLRLTPTWNIRTSTPPLFSPVSVAANSMTAEISIVSPRTLQPGNAWVVFYNLANPVQRPCAVIAGSHALLEAGREERFTVATPFITATPCGVAHLAHIVFRQGAGSTTVYESGNPDLPDASVSYTFVP